MYEWQQLGVFTVLLPFLLVFAIVYAILEKIELFKNRGVNMLIALAIGFFAISNATVSTFFMYLFSNLAWGIAILIAVVVLVGLAIKPGEQTWKTIFIILGIIILLVILSKPTPFGVSGFRAIFGDNFYYWVQQNMPSLILAIIVIIALVAVVIAGKKEEKQKVG